MLPTRRTQANQFIRRSEPGGSFQPGGVSSARQARPGRPGPHSLGRFTLNLQQGRRAYTAPRDISSISYRKSSARPLRTYAPQAAPAGRGRQVGS